MDDLRVILVGGPPGAGKTTLARSIPGRIGFASTTVDDLVTTARLTTSPQTHPALHAMAGVGHLQYFTAGPPERLIADAEHLSETMWPIIDRIVQRHISSNNPVVLDWWLFSPRAVSHVADPHVGSLWLNIDPDALDRREWATTEFREGSADPERMHANFMERSRWRNELVAAQAAEFGLPLLHQPGDTSVEDLTDAAIGLLRGASEST